MSSVDDRVVAMRFDNATFEANAAQTLSTLDRLKLALNFTGASKGLDTVAAATQNVGMDKLGVQVEGVNGGFLALAAVATTALVNITNRAIDAGIALTKSLTIAPIAQGFQEYETKLQSIQTILANTEASGATLDDVKATLQELNTYSDKTIYNFGEMAKNIGTFTAAGVDLKTSAAAIKGIANLAALSGSNSQQAATAMYQLSQAIASGKVGLQDWNSVVNAGMGGTVFQRALAQTAVTMGTLTENSLKLEGPMKRVSINGKSFRDSISGIGGEKWLTSDVLTATLSQFTGDLTDAQLAAQGFNEEQIKAIQQTAQTAQKSATVVKTWSQLVGVLAETAGSGWATTWETIFGDFEEAPKLFTAANNVLSGFINQNADARNKVLADWKALGGRAALIESIKNTFEGLISVIKPIKDAFRDIFPAVTGKQLFAITDAVRDFTENLKIGGETANNIRSIFRGLFAVLDIGWQIIQGVASVLGHLIGVVVGGSGGVLEFGASIGDMLVALDEAIKKGDGLAKFFEVLGGVIALPIRLLQAMAEAISGVFDNIDIGAGATKLIDLLTQVGQAISDAFTLDNVNAGSSLFTAGTLGGIFLLLKGFLGRITSLFDGGLFGGGGFLDSIKDTFNTLTLSLKALQTQIQAKTLLLIAAAVATLAASVLLLSFVDGKKLASSLTAMGVAFGQLLIAMGILIKISGSAGFLKIPIMAASLVILASAMLVLSFAIRNLSSLTWTELLKGLVGVAGAITAIAIAMRLMPKGMLLQSVAILTLSIALNALYFAVKNFGKLDWSDMAKGLVGVAGTIAAVGLAMRLMPKNLLAQSAALVAIGVAMNLIQNAVRGFGDMRWQDIGKGMAAIAASLLIIGVGLRLMPKNILIQAAALNLVATALIGIALAVQLMGNMSMKEIGKGLLVLGGALGILAIALNAMSGTLLGSASLLLAAAGIAALVPSLALMGQLSMKSIGKSLLLLAGALTVLTIAGAALVASGAVLGLLGLGAAALLVGAGLALAGAGFLAFATGLTALVAIGTVGISFLTTLLQTLIAAIPLALQALAQGLVLFAQVIVENAPTFGAAFVALLTTMLTAIQEITPQLGETLLIMLDTALNVLTESQDKLIEAGWQLILSLLQGARDHVGEAVTVATEFIVNFLNALADNADDLADAGVNLVIEFVEAVSSALSDREEDIKKAGEALGESLATGVIAGITGLVGGVVKAAEELWDAAVEASHGLIDNPPFPSRVGMGLGESFAIGIAYGIRDNAAEASKQSSSLVTGAIDSLRSSLSQMSSMVDTAIDTTPVIAPVLDLSSIQKNASQIGGILDQNKINADVSLNQASSIAAAAAAAKNDVENRPDDIGSREVQFIQNNTSPKSLSTLEIYRNTKNLLSLTKEALDIP